ncbi:BrxA family protein [Daejeonella rubra]|nr:BrxA family protein [Daejeonella rubra]
MMKVESKTYDANFTAGGLLLNEFKALESIILGTEFESRLQEEVESNSVIGIATMSARKRIIPQIKRRHSIAPIGFWDHFFQWNQQEMKFGLLYLCFKTYAIVLDIHIEVALKKFKTGNTLNAYDVQMRLDEIASKDDHVSKWSVSTMVKINAQYRRVLKDVGLYDGTHLMRPLKISSTFWQYFEDINESWFLTACFIKN